MHLDSRKISNMHCQTFLLSDIKGSRKKKIAIGCRRPVSFLWLCCLNRADVSFEIYLHGVFILCRAVHFIQLICRGNNVPLFPAYCDAVRRYEPYFTPLEPHLLCRDSKASLQPLSVFYNRLTFPRRLTGGFY